MARRLVSIRRRVRAARRADYRVAWSAVRGAVETAGAHAWAFSSARDAEVVIEFLEFADGSDPRADPGVAAAFGTLDRNHEGVTEEWEEMG